MVEAAELALARRAELLERLAGVFARPEPAGPAGKYLDGLVDVLPRKNGWTLAERAGMRARTRCSGCSMTRCGTTGRRWRGCAGSWSSTWAGPGSKGERDYAWAWIGTADEQHSRLVRRSLSDPTDLAFFYCFTPPGRPGTLPMLVRVAGRRWPIEEAFRTGKDHFGLDHSQVRLYTSPMRHLALAIAALAICWVTAAAVRQQTSTLPPPPADPAEPPPADPGLIPLTVAEVKRLSNLLTRTVHDQAHHLYRAWWRRRHQARARCYHHRTRLHRRLNPP
jgi:hypothetical protein